MHFGTLTIKNFFRVKYLEIDLSKKGLTLVEGKNLDVGRSNETGKSTIFHALCWCLYGRYVGGPARPGDEIVNPLVKHDCYVQVEVFDGDKLTVVRRTRMEGPKHKDAKLYIFSDGEEEVFDLRQKDTADTTVYITKLLDADWDTFVRGRILASEGIEFVTRMKDAALKQFFLESVLNIDWTAQCLEKAKAEKKDLDKKLYEKKYSKQADILQLKKIAERIRDLKKKQATWEGEEQERQKKLDEELSEAITLLDEAKKANESIEKEIEKAKKKHAKGIEVLEKKLAKMPALRDMRSLIEGEDAKLRRLTGRQATAKHEIERLEKQITVREQKKKDAEKYVGQSCESCGSTITKKHLPFMLKEIDAEIVRLHQEIEKAVLEDSQASARIEEIKAILKGYLDEQDGQKDQQKEYHDLRVQISEARRAQDKEIATIKEDLLDLSGTEREITRIIRDQKSQRENPYTALLEKEKGEAREISKEARGLTWEFLKLYDDLEVIEFWVKGFSGSGIQSFLLDDITPIINSSIARYMLYLADGRISVKLSTVEKLKSGEFRERFGIKISNMDGGDTFGSLSSGAKRRVDVAVALSVASFKQSLSHKHLDFLVLDELSAPLDSFWENRLYELLRKHFSTTSTYFITHKEVDNNLFDRVIKVIKEKGITRLEG